MRRVLSTLLLPPVPLPTTTHPPTTPSGVFEAKFQPDGNLAIYNHGLGRPVPIGFWGSKTEGRGHKMKFFTPVRHSPSLQGQSVRHPAFRGSRCF